ncbi:MAG TPA: HPF/RaiA family ribosome-associated protein [Gemmataceae bacterium]|nr:HPF/RaiA family ribosome-associated protein [Gemmataceae bacterium]
MLFQVRTDNHIANSEGLSDHVRAEVEGTLTRRFADRLRRVEVYLKDVNGRKGGIDKNCAVEAHLDGHQPVTAHHRAADIDEAVRGAVDKLARALQHTLGRLADREGHLPASGAPG